MEWFAPILGPQRHEQEQRWLTQLTSTGCRVNKETWCWARLSLFFPFSVLILAFCPEADLLLPLLFF